MDKKIGLFLQGGGAKGAFQAGAIGALAEKGISSQIICGTSIGAINGMIILYQNVHRIKELWVKMIGGKYGKDQTAPVLETKEAIARLGEYLGNERDPQIEHFYVNYLPVKGSQIQHAIADLCALEDEKVYEFVSASSRLPNPFFLQRSGNAPRQELFMQELAKGSFDGYLLDGGLINNRFMEPFLHHDLDLIYAIVFQKDFCIPEAVLEKYGRDKICLIAPDFEFAESDTLNFSMESLEKWFRAGYQKVYEIL